MRSRVLWCAAGVAVVGGQALGACIGAAPGGGAGVGGATAANSTSGGTGGDVGTGGDGGTGGAGGSEPDPVCVGDVCYVVDTYPLEQGFGRPSFALLNYPSLDAVVDVVVAPHGEAPGVPRAFVGLGGGRFDPTVTQLQVVAGADLVVDGDAPFFTGDFGGSAGTDFLHWLPAEISLELWQSQSGPCAGGSCYERRANDYDSGLLTGDTVFAFGQLDGEGSDDAAALRCTPTQCAVTWAAAGSAVTSLEDLDSTLVHDVELQFVFADAAEPRAATIAEEGGWMALVIGGQIDGPMAQRVVTLSLADDDLEVGASFGGFNVSAHALTTVPFPSKRVVALLHDEGWVQILASVDASMLAEVDSFALAAPGGTTGQIRTARVDGDDAPDIVAAVDGDLHWLRNQSTEEQPVFLDAGLLPTSSLGWFDVRDLDGDGRDELVTVNVNRELTILRSFTPP